MVADKTIVEGSGIRFDMLGMLGNDLYKKEIDALNTIFDKYILVLDNFSVDQQGGKDSGLIDPSERMRQLGHDENEIRNHISQLKRERVIEQSARDNFSKLIKSLAKDFPGHAFIIRPHPALYPGYWKVKFADEKNVFVIGKGNVQPWIYGSLVTIQSGCTTAIEALACKVKTIDVSNIIGNRTEAINNSLAAQGNNKPGNIEELKYQILDSIKQESDQKRKSLQSFRWNSKTNSFKENFMQLIEENSCHIRNNIGQELGMLMVIMY